MYKELEKLIDELTGVDEKFKPLKQMTLLERIDNAIEMHYTGSLDYNDVDGYNTFRDIVIYARGISMAGKPVIRAYMTFGDSRSGYRPYWRLFRIDRIVNFTANRKSSRQNKPHTLFNPYGDGSMRSVTKIAKF